MEPREIVKPCCLWLCFQQGQVRVVLWVRDARRETCSRPLEGLAWVKDVRAAGITLLLQKQIC